MPATFTQLKYDFIFWEWYKQRNYFNLHAFDEWEYTFPNPIELGEEYDTRTK
jgi:hypothetical protein